MATVFLVDDHPDVREVMGHLLQMHGHTVEFITNAESAMDRLAEKQPDVIIADNRLPGMSGIELLQHVRTTPAYQQIRCVLFSADDTKRDIAKDIGAHSFWLKGSDTLFDSIAQLESTLDGSPGRR